MNILDYYDRSISRQFSLIDNIFLNYLLGFFGWVFNREKCFLFQFLINYHNYNHPERVTKYLGIKLSDQELLDNRLKLQVFHCIYTCLTVLSMVYGFTNQLKVYFSR